MHGNRTKRTFQSTSLPTAKKRSFLLLATLIISLQWHLSRGGIYYATSEQSVLEVDVLEAGKMGNRKDLSDFDKGHIVMA